MLTQNLYEELYYKSNRGGNNMNKVEMVSSKFNNYIKEATSELHNYKLEESYKTIIKALNANPSAPEPHNLLGIWYEFKGIDDLARKHYRAAYALDPTYKPASENLQRVCTIFASKTIPFDFGEDNLEKSEEDIIKEKGNDKSGK